MLNWTSGKWVLFWTLYTQSKKDMSIVYTYYITFRFHTVWWIFYSYTNMHINVMSDKFYTSKCVVFLTFFFSKQLLRRLIYRHWNKMLLSFIQFLWSRKKITRKPKSYSFYFEIYMIMMGVCAYTVASRVETLFCICWLIWVDIWIVTVPAVNLFFVFFFCSLFLVLCFLTNYVENNNNLSFG